MQFLSVPAALLLSAVAGVAATGTAFPPHIEMPKDELRPGELLLIPVSGCHANVRTHYVPEFGRTLPHFHQGDDCRPVPAARQQDDRPVDCHRDARRHRIDGIMILHRHVGKNCAVREVRKVS